jgi:hypothetical protein
MKRLFVHLQLQLQIINGDEIGFEMERKKYVVKLECDLFTYILF